MTEPQALEDTQGYQKSAYRADTIPPLPSPKRRRERSLDELLPFGSYTGIDPYQRLCEDTKAVQYKDRQDQCFYEKEWWWDHQRIRFLNEKMGLLILLMAIPYLWGLVLIAGGELFLILTVGKKLAPLPHVIGLLFMMIIFGTWLFISLFVYKKTTPWIMNGIAWLLMPFEKIINRKLDKSFAEGSSEFNRLTGKVSFAQGKHKPPFEAPFVEFDAYAERVIQHGGTFYRLIFVHRYSGKTFSRMWLHGTTHDLTEVYAFWDMLQRYMDVSLPLPDVPRLEPFRDRDPVTAEHDRQTGRDPRFWRDLDLEAWKQGAGAELSHRQQTYPWQQLRCRLTPQLGRIEMADYFGSHGHSKARPV